MTNQNIKMINKKMTESVNSSYNALDDMGNLSMTSPRAESMQKSWEHEIIIDEI